MLQIHTTPNDRVLGQFRHNGIVSLYGMTSGALLQVESPEFRPVAPE